MIQTEHVMTAGFPELIFNVKVDESQPPSKENLQVFKVRLDRIVDRQRKPKELAFQDAFSAQEYELETGEGKEDYLGSVRYGDIDLFMELLRDGADFFLVYGNYQLEYLGLNVYYPPRLKGVIFLDGRENIDRVLGEGVFDKYRRKELSAKATRRKVAKYRLKMATLMLEYARSLKNA